MVEKVTVLWRFIISNQLPGMREYYFNHSRLFDDGLNSKKDPIKIHFLSLCKHTNELPTHEI